MFYQLNFIKGSTAVFIFNKVFIPSNVQRACAGLRTLRLFCMLAAIIKRHLFHFHKVSNWIKALLTGYIKFFRAMNIFNRVITQGLFFYHWIAVHVI